MPAHRLDEHFDDASASRAEGVVELVFSDARWGTTVIIRHDGTLKRHAPVQYRTGYVHLSRATVGIGDHVRRGRPDDAVPCPMGLRKVAVTAELASGRRAEGVTDDTGAVDLALPADEPAGDVVVRAPGLEPQTASLK